MTIPAQQSPRRGVKTAAHAEPTSSNDTSQSSSPTTAHAGAQTTARSDEDDDDDDSDDADKKPLSLAEKMAELAASGWRPEEEMLEEPQDDDYGDVNLLSDSDDEDGDIRKHEETVIFAENADMLSYRDQSDLARRLSLSSAGSDKAYAEFTDNDIFSETVFSTIPVYDGLMAARADQPENDMLTSHESLRSDDHASRRRVRFATEEKTNDVDMDTSDDSDEGDDEDDDDEDGAIFPDLFISQDRLDPYFRSVIEDDRNPDNDDNGSDAESCWDFEGDTQEFHFDDDYLEDSEDSSAGSSGYESDDGDTTDDEETPQSPPRIDLAREVSPPSSSGSGAATPDKRPSRAPRPASRTPKLGSFVMNPRRAVLTIEGGGRTQKATCWPARIPSTADVKTWKRLTEVQNSVNNSRSGSPRTSISQAPTPRRGVSVDSLSGFFDVSGALRADQVLGPAEAFMPFADISTSGSVTHDDTMAEAEDEDGDDPLSFINFDSESDEDDAGDASAAPDDSDAVDSPAVKFPHVTSNSSKSGAAFDLLAHLDRTRGVVGSFRRNQMFARHVGSLPSHPALRASTSETNAMQTGKRSAGNTPITPLRKRRAGKIGVGPRGGSTFSPLGRGSVTKKRH